MKQKIMFSALLDTTLCRMWRPRLGPKQRGDFWGTTLCFLLLHVPLGLNRLLIPQWRSSFCC